MPPPRAAERERRAHDERQPDLGDAPRARRRRCGRSRCVARAARRRSSSRGSARGPRRGRSRRSRRRSARRRAWSSVPSSCSALARFSAVWPPSVGSSASGFSRSITWRHRPGQQRLDVGRGGDLGVGHDRRRVGVDEHDLVALLHQHPARLGARVVELGGLADHDRAGADQQDLVEVVAAGMVRRRPISSTKRSNRYSASCGPGPASGWYWTVAPWTSRSARPSTVRS